jgi:hypothetical protein
MTLLKFKEWNRVNESKISDKLKNWFSGAFGGAIHKLDSLLSEYKTSELRFVDEWDDIKTEIDSLSLERSQKRNDPADAKRIDRMIDRNQAIIPAATKAKEKKSEEVMLKAKNIIGDNKRLQSYWDTKKATVDSEISEEMYKRAKRLTDSSLADDLYSKYKKAVTRAKEKDEAFKAEYGDYSFGRVPSYTPERSYGSHFDIAKRSTPVDSVGGMESSFELLSKLSLVEFTEAIKGFPKDQAKKLATFLTNERDDRYVSMDMERDLLNTEVEKNPNDHKTREYASKKIKEIREKYMGEIRDLRSKITIIKRYA